MSKIDGLDIVLLIDDDLATVYYNEMIIGLLGITVKPVDFRNGQTAIEYISDPIHQKSGIILLDLNMPGFNGWDFLNQYQTFDPTIKQRFKLCVLTTSMNKDDEVAAKKYEEVCNFWVKPLREDTLTQFINKNYLIR